MPIAFGYHFGSGHLNLTRRLSRQAAISLIDIPKPATTEYLRTQANAGKHFYAAPAYAGFLRVKPFRHCCKQRWVEVN